MSMKLRLLLSSLWLASLPLAATAAEVPPAGPGSSLTVGAGIGSAPRFPGSSENQTAVLPLLDYQHESGFFASTRRGIGWGGGSESITYSLAVAARGERREKPRRMLGAGNGGKELQGMGDVKASALGALGVGLRLGSRFGLNALLELPLTQRDNGRALHLGGSVLLLKSGQDELSLDATLSHGDGRYMRTYFGVSAQQSQKSGYAAFTPRAGFHKAELTLGWNHRIDDRWGLTVMGGVSRLLDDAAASPLARRRTAPQAGVLLTYTL